MKVRVIKNCQLCGGTGIDPDYSGIALTDVQCRACDGSGIVIIPMDALKVEFETKKPLPYFHDVKVGDRVWDYTLGSGCIYKICNDSATCPIYVKFDYRGGSNNFTMDGRIYSGEQNQRLFYYDNRPIVITQDDLDLSEDMDYYFMDEFGLHEGIINMARNRVYGQLHMKDKDFRFERKVHREEPEMVEMPDKMAKVCEERLKAGIEQVRKDWFIRYRGECPDEEAENDDSNMTLKDLEAIANKADECNLSPIEIEGEKYHKLYSRFGTYFIPSTK